MNGRGDSALHAATSNGDSVVVKTLLEEGADANQKNEYVCFWLREGLCVTLVAAGVVGLLFTWQLRKAICRVWSFWWLGARTCMFKTSECC